MVSRGDHDGLAEIGKGIAHERYGVGAYEAAVKHVARGEDSVVVAFLGDLDDARENLAQAAAKLLARGDGNARKR